MSEAFDRTGICIAVVMTLGFGLVVFGFQTGNLLLTAAGGTVMVALVVALELYEDSDEPPKRAIESFDKQRERDHDSGGE